MSGNAIVWEPIRKISTQVTRQGMLIHSHLSSLSHYGLILAKSKTVSVGTEEKNFLTLANAVDCNDVPVHWVSLLSWSFRGLRINTRFRMYISAKLVNMPSAHLKSVMFLGSGMLPTALNFVWSGLIPSSLMICPKNSTSFLSN